MKFLQSISLFIICGCLTSMAQVQIIAHRGASAYETENSLAAFKKAFVLDADAIEMDIWRTTDDSLVIMHDRTTKRVADRDLIVPESTAAELRALTLKNGEKIPFVEEAIRLVPEGKKIVIELKCGFEEGKAGNVFPMLKDILERSGRVNDAILIAFNSQALADAKKHLPGNPCYYLSGEKDKEDELIATCKNLGLEGLNVHFSLLTKSLTKKTKKAGLDLMVWTVDMPEIAIEAAKRYKVSGITTNKPDLIREAVFQTKSKNKK